MEPRFKVIETTRLDDVSKRYRVVDLVEGGSASKQGVCSRLEPRERLFAQH